MSGRRRKALRAAFARSVGRAPLKSVFRGFVKRGDRFHAVHAPQDEMRVAKRAYSRRLIFPSRRGMPRHVPVPRPPASSPRGLLARVLGRAA